MPPVTIAVLLAVVAVGIVGVGVSLIVRFDRSMLRGVLSGSTVSGSRGARRHARKASPALYLLASLLVLLAIATFVSRERVSRLGRPSCVGRENAN